MATNSSPKLKSTIKESHLKYHKLIGRGSTGDVYHVTWKSKTLGKVDAAAKKIPLFEGKTIEEQLGDEIHFLQKLDHPNIIQYYGQIVKKDYIVIVTEYASRGSLYDYLKDKTTLPAELKAKWTIQAAKGIKYLQENHILHRDIKSPNFLITAGYDLKICDFGIAKDLTSTKTTVSNKGTTKWMAPEVFTDLQLSPTADIFAFGIVLWEMETCSEPYEGIRPEAVMYKIVTQDLRPTIPENCPKGLEGLMQGCWSKDRHQRPGIDAVIRQIVVIYHDVIGSKYPQSTFITSTTKNLYKMKVSTFRGKRFNSRQ